MSSKPKLAIVTGTKNSATHKVMVSHLPYWEKDFNITLLENFPGICSALDEFDLAHFAWIGYVKSDVVPPFTANVWQVPVHLTSDYSKVVAYSGVERIVVDDLPTRNMLGQFLPPKIVHIPLAFTYPRKLLPYPEEFSIGYFGNNYEGKRFGIIDAAGKLAGVKVAGYGLNTKRPTYSLDPEELYQTMSVYVHASYCDTNSMPCMEALMHGRPVIAVWSDGLARTVSEPNNGLWFDGTVEDLVEKIHKMKQDFASFLVGTIRTTLLPVEESAAKYARMFQDVLNEN